ncbi:MAG: DUF4091 domain-containing protein [Clostridia bacterium]|nr:DUF4091 domain-containing protein [Clostridia bacterium]
MKKIKAFISIAFSAITLFSAAACEGTTSSSTPTGAVDYDVWGKEGHVKVFADREYDASFRRALAIDVGACKNEYEAAQIVLTANKGNVGAYTLEISDLTSDSGDTFSKENISVYNQKYVNINSLTYENNYGLGWYPDALLPFEKAVEYGENKVKEGNNQGIYIEAYVPEDTKAGVYRGNFTLTVDGERHDVPAQIEVYDYTVTSANHLASLFATHFERMVVGEKNATVAMQEKYFETFMEFRVNPGLKGDRPSKEWIDNIRLYCNPEKTPLTSTLGTIGITVDKSGTGVNVDKFRKQVIAVAAASIVDGIDYVDLLDTRCGWIDEPHLNGTHDLVNTALASYNAARSKMADDIRTGAVAGDIKTAVADLVGVEMTDAEFNEKFGAMQQQLADSAAGILNVITSLKDTRFTEDVESFCVTRSGVMNAKDREYYKDLEDNQWWYFCGSGSDVLSYGIDAPLLEARMVGWASYDYGYVGDVFWETVMHTKQSWNSVGRVNVETAINPYEDAYHCSNAPGDGFLVYPGKQYGIFGPVTCVRLHAIRDGREEYEMLYDLQQKYASNGYSPRALLNVLFKDLYKNIELTANADDVFVQSRKTLIELCMLANKGVFVTDYEEVGTEAKITVRCNGEMTISKLGGEEKTASESYETTVSLTNANNIFRFELTDGTKFAMSLGGKQQIIKTLESASNMTVISGAELSDNTIDGVKGVKVKLTETEFGDSTVSIPVGSTAITKNHTSFSVRIYNPNAKKTYVSVYLSGSGGMALAGDAVLYSGWNTVQINKPSDIKWSNVKKLDSVQLIFSLGDNEVKTDYDGLTVAYIAVEE